MKAMRVSALLLTSPNDPLLKDIHQPLYPQLELIHHGKIGLASAQQQSLMYKMWCK